MNTGKFQLTCPNCNHEFNYDRNYLNRNIDELSKELLTINRQLSDYNSKSTEYKKANRKWYLNAKKAFSIKSVQVKELKDFRKVAEHRKKEMEFQLFKNAIKEICGNDVFDKCCELVDENMVAYNILDTSKVSYTRSKGQSIISVNKI